MNVAQAIEYRARLSERQDAKTIVVTYVEIISIYKEWKQNVPGRLTFSQPVMN